MTLAPSRKRKPYNWTKPPGRPRKAFEDFYMPEPNTGCWLWIGSTKPFGYGSYSYRDADGHHNINAHRKSWMLYRGPIPDGLCVLHRCDVPQCVNPDHLFLGTLKDNSQDACKKRRMNAPGITKGFPRMNAERTHCKRGHPFNAKNTRTHLRDGRPIRNCRICTKASSQRSTERNREAIRARRRKKYGETGA
jgi:hypothetical protein